MVMAIMRVLMMAISLAQALIQKPPIETNEKSQYVPTHMSQMP